jgi:hypothetical protein
MSSWLGGEPGYLADSLREAGFIGVTGRTPYRPVSAPGVQYLHELSVHPPLEGVDRVVAPDAAVISVLFDGTLDNGWFPAPGAVPTNVFRLSRLQAQALGVSNTFYRPGIGAAEGSPGAGRPDVPARTWEALPVPAGEAGQRSVEQTYAQLLARVQEVRAEAPGAPISIHLAGFSRGAAQAVALANLIDARGVPGVGAPGQVRVDTLLLFDPVDMTGGVLDTRWPRNVGNALVLVAMGERRHIMPPMRVGPDALVVGIPEAAHGDVGGAYDERGIGAVTLGVAADFLRASGMALPPLPEPWLPDWERMRAHDPSLDNYGQRLWSVDEAARYYEGAPRTAPSLQETVCQRTAPPGCEAWLAAARAQLVPALQAAAQWPAGEDVPPPRFLLASDGQHLGVWHASGVLQEFSVGQALQAAGAVAPERGLAPDAGDRVLGRDKTLSLQ